jgi:predicted nucleic acid-binding protein
VIVADASAIIEFLLQTELGMRVEGRLYGGSDALHAPHLLDVEILSAMRRFVRKGDVTLIRAEEALEDLSLLRIVRHVHIDLRERVWELRDNVTAYDAVYLALAESLDATLVTCDAPLARSHGHSARIQLIT